MKMTKKNTKNAAVEFQTCREAVDYAVATEERYKAIFLNGPKAMKSDDVDRLVDAGVAFSFLCDHKGRLVTIPVH